MSDSDDTDIIAEVSKFRTMRMFPNWPEIKEKLKQMAEGIMNSEQIIETLSIFNNISYSSRYEKNRAARPLQFDVLMEQYDDQLPQIFSKIAGFVLLETSYEYPLFRKYTNAEHTFKKQEALFLLCSMVLQLLPKQQYHTQQSKRNYSYQLDFSMVFRCSVFKTKSIIEFIKREISNKESYKDTLTIKRRYVPKDIGKIIKEYSQANMSKFNMKGDDDSIENYYGQIKVDFANKFIGGGSLGMGCVQQEIMFANHPQLFISHLLCQALEPSESLLFIGFKKYNKSQGYSYNTKYRGAETFSYQKDQNYRAKQFIIAIDAVSFHLHSPAQFELGFVQREIKKAYCGFSFEEGKELSIVSGNWGCGAFGGNAQLKLIIQWIACTLAGRQLIYCPFGSSSKLNHKQLFKIISSMKVQKVYDTLLRTCSRIKKDLHKKKKQEQINVFEQFFEIVQEYYSWIVID